MEHGAYFSIIIMLIYYRLSDVTVSIEFCVLITVWLLFNRFTFLELIQSSLQM